MALLAWRRCFVMEIFRSRENKSCSFARECCCRCTQLGFVVNGMCFQITGVDLFLLIQLTARMISQTSFSICSHPSPCVDLCALVVGTLSVQTESALSFFLPLFPL